MRYAIVTLLLVYLLGLIAACFAVDEEERMGHRLIAPWLGIFCWPLAVLAALFLLLMRAERASRTGIRF